MIAVCFAGSVFADDFDDYVKQLKGGKPDEKASAAEQLNVLKDDRAIPVLIEALRDNSAKVRRAAASSLSGFAETLSGTSQPEEAGSTLAINVPSVLRPAVPALIACLRDSNLDVRYSAAEALGRIRDQQAIGPLLNALRSKTADETAFSYTDALDKMTNANSFAQLINALKSDSEAVKQYAVAAMDKVVDARAIPELIKALKDPDVEVRKTAVKCLGKLNAREAFSGLAEAVKDSNEQVRQKAIFSLAQLRMPEALPVFIAALKDRSWRVRLYAAKAINLSPDPSAVPALLGVLNDPEDEVSNEVVSALNKLKRDPQALPYFVRILKESKEDFVREYAASALGNTRSQSVVPDLVEALKDRDENVRRNSAEALGKICDRRTVPVLLSALKESSPKVRAAAALALYNIGDQSTVPDLIRALGDADFNVSFAANKGLERMLEFPDDAMIERIRPMLGDANEKIRVFTAKKIAELKNEQAVRILMEFVRTGSDDVRRTAITALIGHTSRAQLQLYMSLLGDGNAHARECAAMTLGEISDTSALDALAERQQSDPDENVREEAKKAIEKINNNQNTGAARR